MDIEVLKRSLDRTDALESVVRELISVLTPEQLSAFQSNTKKRWELAEKMLRLNSLIQYPELKL
ncbi:Uncharacterised protein [Salmonella enterica subsp. enterica]|uniref:Uncharacterized protein n=1 Tax=Salmonella enterica I TaxID=59201 RepID=A0A379W9G8_SALET|nr:Uncharacterised protein [Salmonella enterica subsp. enterica]